METYLTIKELAEYLRLTDKTIQRWVINGELPYHKIKKVIRFRVSEIEKWINESGWKIQNEKAGVIEGSLFDEDELLEELEKAELAAGTSEGRGGV